MVRLKEKTTELVILSIMYIAMMSYCYVVIFGECINFIDTDDFMRVIRTREFFQHYDLNNHVIARSNYPYGCELHWSRLYDFFIIGLTWIINLFVNSFEQSINYACFCISPIIGLVSMVFVFKIFDMFTNKSNVFLATALFCASPLLIPFFSFGRPDHHAFITLCMLVYIYYTAKMVLDETESKSIYVKTAVAATACVWASPETLIVLLLTDAVLFFAYMNNFSKTKNLYFKSLLTACFVGTIALIPEAGSKSVHAFSICLLLMLMPYTTLSKKSLENDPFFKSWHFVCLMFMMVLLTDIQPAEYDKISMVHATLFLCLATFFAVNLLLINRRSHLYDAIIWALAIACVFLSMFPRFLMGMSADIPQFIKDIWLCKISELRSPLTGDMIYTFSVGTVITFAAIIVKIQELKNQTISGKNIIWTLFLVLAAGYWVLACFAYRMIPYSFLFGLPIIVSFGMSSKYVKKYSKPVRMIITMIIACFFIFATSLFVKSDLDDKKPKNHQYSDAELFKYVDDLSSEPVVVMAHSNHGAKLLYYTKHCILGAPYHRQIEGITSSYVVMEMDNDLSAVRKVLQKTKSKYLFIGHKQESQFPNSFASSVLAGHIPQWLSVVKIPEKFSDYSIFKIDQNLISQEIKSEKNIKNS
ncbi:MAG: hypothetical protein J6T91_03005 [Alphaproteobacteria bacterium]|nr:hypothetical protein [Alphaproteobacteria bacterium]